MEIVAQVARASPPDLFESERPELEPPADHIFLLVHFTSQCIISLPYISILVLCMGHWPIEKCKIRSNKRDAT